MQIQRALLFCGVLFSCGSAIAQPDYQRHATSLKPAPADPAIARVLASITPAQIDQTVKALVSFGTRNTLTSMDSNLPSGQGINAAADWIASQFEAISQQCGGCLEVKRDTFTADPASGEPWARRIPKPTKIANVYAVMRGSDPERARQMVLVTGHYDSMNSNTFANWSDTSGAAPGANDDASGVAVSLACARALSQVKFPSTIVFVAVAGEEQGLVGSEHLAKLAKSEGWQLEAVLNNDIVGGNTTPGDTLQMKDRVRVFSEGVPVAATAQEQQRIRALGKENDSSSRELAREVADVDRTYLARAASPSRFSAFLVDRPDRYLRGGDHSSFNREGFAAVRFTEWREDFNHQHKNVVRPPAGSSDPVQGDLPEFVDYKYVAQVARLNAATLATLAFAPGKPQKVAIEAKDLGNGTTLTWEAPAGGGVAHYEVLWRETTSPDWQYVKEVAPSEGGGDISVSLPISKDNVIFGVRAVDAKGHRGLVLVP
ncbi:M28 family metallopeptidase [Occallatibacter savannae]|uniref:M28 family metallopeptidase n=1 Tax=Occallatibacter savannae TaxID=1002691 RepID=UPI000D694803|nr:M28 family metallopeptidase [Occallatibacter savannae]